MKIRIFKRGVILTLLGVLSAALVSCETTQLGLGRAKDKASTGVPKEGMVGAKATALAHAMDTLPDEDRKFLDDDYAAYGLLDTDPVHQKALLAILSGRQPPVIDASLLYGRTSNAQWYDGRPALKWTASAAMVEGSKDRAEVVVGWMHSQIINRFTTYTMAFNGTSWDVVDVEILTEAEDALRSVD